MAQTKNMERFIGRRNILTSIRDGEDKLKENTETLHQAMLRFGESPLDRFWYLSGVLRSRCGFIPCYASSLLQYLNDYVEFDPSENDWNAVHHELGPQPLVTMNRNGSSNGMFMIPVGAIFAHELNKTGEAECGLTMHVDMFDFESPAALQQRIEKLLVDQGLDETLYRVNCEHQKLADKLEDFDPEIEFPGDDFKLHRNGFEAAFELGATSTHYVRTEIFDTILRLRAAKKFLHVVADLPGAAHA